MVGTVARLTEQKGHRYLLDAIGLLAARYPSLLLLVVGDGSLEADLRAQAERLRSALKRLRSALERLRAQLELCTAALRRLRPALERLRAQSERLRLALGQLRAGV